VLRLLPPNLQSLKLTELNCNESLFEGLVSQLPKTLTSLDLSHARLAGVGVQGPSLKPLQGLVNLQALNLGGTTGGVLAADMSFLEGMTALTNLHIDHVHAGAAAAVPAVVQAGVAAAAAAAGCEVPVINAAQTTVAAPTGSSVTAGVGHAAARCTMSQMFSVPAVDSSTSSSSSSSECTFLLDSPVLPVADKCQQQQHHHQSLRVAALPASDTCQQQQQQQCHQSSGVAVLLMGLSSSQLSAKSTSSSTSKQDCNAVAAKGTQLQTYSRQSSLYSSSSSAGTSVRRNLFAATAQLSPLPSQSLPQDSPTEVEIQRHQQQWQQQQQQVWLQVSPSVQQVSVSFSPGLGDAELASLSGITALQSVDLLACHTFTGVSQLATHLLLQQWHSAFHRWGSFV
jgi:hypothetical protein